jgi:hypothetical protein
MDPERFKTFNAAKPQPKKTVNHKGRKKDVGATGWSPSFAA